MRRRKHDRSPGSVRTGLATTRTSGEFPHIKSDPSHPTTTTGTASTTPEPTSRWTMAATTRTVPRKPVAASSRSWVHEGCDEAATNRSASEGLRRLETLRNRSSTLVVHLDVAARTTVTRLGEPTRVRGCGERNGGGGDDKTRMKSIG